jgi:hypothetical protein
MARGSRSRPIPAEGGLDRPLGGEDSEGRGSTVTDTSVTLTLCACYVDRITGSGSAPGAGG